MFIQNSRTHKWEKTRLVFLALSQFTSYTLVLHPFPCTGHKFKLYSWINLILLPYTLSLFLHPLPARLSPCPDCSIFADTVKWIMPESLCIEMPSLPFLLYCDRFYQLSIHPQSTLYFSLKWPENTCSFKRRFVVLFLKLWFNYIISFPLFPFLPPNPHIFPSLLYCKVMPSYMCV